MTLFPGGYFAAVDTVDIAPFAVNGVNLDELLGFDFLQIREHENWGSSGLICSCHTQVNPGSPTISASFDGRRLVINYERAPLFVPAYEPNAIWIGAPPSDLFAETGKSTAYYLVANVVPLPSAFWLFAPAIGGFGLMRRKVA